MWVMLMPWASNTVKTCLSPPTLSFMLNMMVCRWSSPVIIRPRAACTSSGACEAGPCRAVPHQKAPQRRHSAASADCSRPLRPGGLAVARVLASAQVHCTTYSGQGTAGMPLHGDSHRRAAACSLSHTCKHVEGGVGDSRRQAAGFEGSTKRYCCELLHHAGEQAAERSRPGGQVGRLSKAASGGCTNGRLEGLFEDSP